MKLTFRLRAEASRSSLIFHQQHSLLKGNATSSRPQCSRWRLASFSPSSSWISHKGLGKAIRSFSVLPVVYPSEHCPRQLVSQEGVIATVQSAQDKLPIVLEILDPTTTTGTGSSMSQQPQQNPTKAAISHVRSVPCASTPPLTRLTIGQAFDAQAAKYAKSPPLLVFPLLVFPSCSPSPDDRSL